MPAPELNSSLQPASVVPPRADALEDKDNHVVQTVENNPVFGHGMLKYWDFQPGYVNLNSGGYGTCPRPVFEVLHNLQLRAESAPDIFLTRYRPAALKRAIKRIETYLHAEAGTIVITANASTGTNAVFRDFPWAEGDVVLLYSSVYLSLLRTVTYVQDRARAKHPFPQIETVSLEYPCSLASVLAATRAKLDDMKAKGRLPRMAVFDTVSSRPGVAMPFYDLAALFRSYSVLTFVDGAHGLGAVRIDLQRLNPDFFVSNAHKWQYAPRGNAVLYVAPRNRALMLSSVPTTWAPSWDDMWAFPGTIDFAHALAINAAIDFYERIGGQDRIHAYIRALAIRGGEVAARELNTRSMRLTPAEVGEEGDPDELTVIAANVQLPLKKDAWDNASTVGGGWFKPGGINDYIQTHLYDEFNTVIPIYETGGHLWARLSSQVYLEESDFLYGARALKELCRRINEGEANLSK